MSAKEYRIVFPDCCSQCCGRYFTVSSEEVQRSIDPMSFVIHGRPDTQFTRLRVKDTRICKACGNIMNAIYERQIGKYPIGYYNRTRHGPHEPEEFEFKVYSPYLSTDQSDSVPPFGIV